MDHIEFRFRIQLQSFILFSSRGKILKLNKLSAYLVWTVRLSGISEEMAVP